MQSISAKRVIGGKNQQSPNDRLMQMGDPLGMKTVQYAALSLCDPIRRNLHAKSIIKTLHRRCESTSLTCAPDADRRSPKHAQS